MTWPIAPDIGHKISWDLRDSLLQTWQVAWGGYALVHQPSHYFDANAFWPFDRSLTFSDALVGYAPLAVFGHGPEAALVTYNVLYLFAYALAFAGTYLLARELGTGPLAAAVAGAAFAYAPWRIYHAPHLNILSSGGISLSLFLLLRGYRRRRPRTVLAGWLVATWQISLGWNLGLQFAYLLAFFSLLTVAVWLIRGRPNPGRKVIGASVFGIGVLVAVTAVLARPYLQTAREYPESRRSIDIVAYFSPPPKAFLAAPGYSLVWGRATKGIRESLASREEESLFPGAMTLALALLGVAAPAYSRRARIGLALAAVVFAVYSLGFGIQGARLTYGFLYYHLPGWQGLRTPGRITTLTSLALALLAAAGAHYLIGVLGSRRRDRRGGAATATPVAAALLLLGAVLLEGYGKIPHPDVPSSPPELAAARPPLLELPFGYDFDENLYMYWSTGGFYPIVNGLSGFRPTASLKLIERMTAFPDATTVAELRSLGVRTVVLHLDLARDTKWSNAGARPVRSLPLVRTRVSDLVLFEIAPS